MGLSYNLLITMVIHHLFRGGDPPSGNDPGRSGPNLASVGILRIPVLAN